MTFALDRDAITGDVLKDGSAPCYTAVPPQFATGPDGSDFSADQTKYAEYCAFDAAKAAEYYETAKSELGKDSFTFDMIVDADDAPQKVAQVVKEQLETTLPGFTLNPDRRAQEAACAGYAGWQLSRSPSPVGDPTTPTP